MAEKIDICVKCGQPCEAVIGFDEGAVAEYTMSKCCHAAVYQKPESDLDTQAVLDAADEVLRRKE